MAKAKEARTKLSRKDMETVIKRGGSILHDGEIITKIKDLPDEIDLAETDEELEAATAKLDAEENAVAAKKTKAQTKAAKGKGSSKKSGK